MNNKRCRPNDLSVTKSHFNGYVLIPPLHDIQVFEYKFQLTHVSLSAGEWMRGPLL